MSHYITATINEEDVEFTFGTNHRTIRAASDSGFDIYELYNASEYNNGMSGSGESTFVNNEIAKNAYKHAIAWVLALKQSYPKIFEKKISQIAEYDKQFERLFNNDIFNKEELDKLIKEKKELHDFLDDNDVELSFRLLKPIPKFSYSIYKGTNNGIKVEISFC